MLLCPVITEPIIAKYNFSINFNLFLSLFITDQQILSINEGALVNALAVLPNGYLASGSWDNTIKIWDTETGSEIRNLTGHTNWVRALAVMPNGYLASGSADTTIKIWN